MTVHHPKIDELVRRDPRYPYEAYEFLFASLAHTQELLERTPPKDRLTDQQYHVSGRELLEGVRDLALREFGLMARTVFRTWGINRTDDIGEMVFNLVEAGLMSKTNEDQRQDFRDVYDLEKALVEDYRIEVGDEVEEAP